MQPVPIRDDAWAYADLSDGFIRLFVVDRGLEEDFFRIGDFFLRKPGNVLDVGANYGLLSFGLSTRTPDGTRFHLFEPNPSLVPLIRRSQEAFPRLSLTVMQAAVSDAPGSLRIAFDAQHSGQSHFDPDNGCLVPAITLDEYSAQANIDSIAFLKIDVEGYELGVLRGASELLARKAIAAIYFEYFEKWLDRLHPPADLLRFLEAAGYDVFLCRRYDLDLAGGATHHVQLAGAELPLRSIRDTPVPAQTDLLALPMGVASSIGARSQ